MDTNNDKATFERQQREAAFYQGVDAAKEAIRSEKCGDEGHEYCAATFINAIARKCGFTEAQVAALSLAAVEAEKGEG